MARLVAPDREIPPWLRASLDDHVDPGESIWAVVAGELGGYLVATDRELLHVVRGRNVGSWRLEDLDDVRPVGGTRAILVRRRDGTGDALTFRLGAGHPEAVQAITVLELLIVRASRALPAPERAVLPGSGERMVEAGPGRRARCGPMPARGARSAGSCGPGR
jgi:hypothetical protein